MMRKSGILPQVGTGVQMSLRLDRWIILLLHNRDRRQNKSCVRPENAAQNVSKNF
jgi:hypothetical protein